MYDDVFFEAVTGRADDPSSLTAECGKFKPLAGLQWLVLGARHFYCGTAIANIIEG